MAISHFFFVLLVTCVMGFAWPNTYPYVSFLRADDKPSTPDQSKDTKKEERTRLLQQTQKLREEEKLTEAVAEAKKLLAVEQDVFGPKHIEITRTLALLAELHETLEDYVAAITARKEVLSIATASFGDSDWRVTNPRLSLRHTERMATLSAEQRQQLKEAEKAFARAQDCYDNPSTPDSLKNGLVHAQRAMKICKQVLGENNKNYVWCLQCTGRLHQELQNFDEALWHLTEAVRVMGTLTGLAHPDYAINLMTLAGLHESLNDFEQAERLFRQTLEIDEALFGKVHVNCASELNNIGLLYQNRGNYFRAEAFLLRATEIWGNAEGNEYRQKYANSLHNLGKLYLDMGDHKRAKQNLTRALDILKSINLADHIQYASSVNGLALVHDSIKEFKQAEDLLRQALKIRGEKLPKMHPHYISTLQNLAGVCAEQGKHDEAEKLLRQSRDLLVNTKSYTKAVVLTNLANICVIKKNYTEAMLLITEALQLMKSARGEEHADYGKVLISLGLIHVNKNESKHAIDSFLRGLQNLRNNMELASAIQSERQQMDMAFAFRKHLDRFITLSPQLHIPAENVYEQVLVWKGSVFSRQRSIRLALASSDVITSKMARELQQAVNRLAYERFSAPPQQHDEARNKRLQALAERVENLEGTLAQRTSEFRKVRDTHRQTPANVQAALPPGVALIDFLEYSSVSPAEWGTVAKEERRLMVFVIRRDAPVQQIDLGLAAPISKAVANWRAASLDEDGLPADAHASAAELRRLIWEPLASAIEGATILLYSPDGPVSRLPLTALPGQPPHKFLAQEYFILTVPVPQLLPQLLTEKGNTLLSPALLLVDQVDFDVDPKAGDQIRPVPPEGIIVRNGQLNRAGSFGRIHHGTDYVQDLFKKSFSNGAIKHLQGLKATKSAFREQARGHQYIHVITHGFSTQLDGMVNGPGVHPALLSGFAFAGANRQQPVIKSDADADDGIMTAMEVSQLDLSNIELAVLMACETSLGEIASGEGVLSLQRAFHVAGARSVLASLWSVKENTSEWMMKEYYRQLWEEKVSPIEAIWRTQLAMIEGRGPGDSTHPRNWAAWTLSGYPGDLATIIKAKQQSDQLPRAEDNNDKKKPSDINSTIYTVVTTISIVVAMIVLLLLWMRRRRLKGAI